MRNKLIIGAASAALMLAIAVPAFAKEYNGSKSGNTTTNTAIVNNYSSAGSNTGGNGQTGGNNTMYTGAATSSSTAVVIANTQVGCNTCQGTKGGNKTTNTAVVINAADAVSNTGMNGQTNPVPDPKKYRDEGQGSNGGTNWMGTGNATSTANAWVVVNTQVSGSN